MTEPCIRTHKHDVVQVHGTRDKGRDGRGAARTRYETERCKELIAHNRV